MMLPLLLWKEMILEFSFLYTSKDEGIDLLKTLVWQKEEDIIKYKLLSHMKLGREIITFGDIEIEKHNFHR